MERLSMRILEISIISAEALRVRGREVKRKTFVTIRPDSDSQLLRTTEKNGGNDPRWNEKLEMILPPNVKFIRAEVYSTNGRDCSLIGTARIPVTDFAFGNYVHMLSYRLKDKSGDRNGVLNISVRNVEKPGASAVATSFQGYGSGSGYGYRVGNNPCGGGRVALGIPVSSPYPYSCFVVR